MQHVSNFQHIKKREMSKVTSVAIQEDGEQYQANTTQSENSPNSHRGKYLQRIRSLSSSQGGTCSPPSTPWLLSFSTHWRGQTHTQRYKHTQSCHQSPVINRVKGQWCKAADFKLKAMSPGAAVSWKKMKLEAWEKSTGEMRKNEKCKLLSQNSDVVQPELNHLN